MHEKAPNLNYVLVFSSVESESGVTFAIGGVEKPEKIAFSVFPSPPMVKVTTDSDSEDQNALR